MNRRRWWFIHGLDPAKWARRWGIEPFSYPCDRCGALLETTLPFVLGKLHGLAAPRCVCGNDRTPFAVMLQDGDTG